MGFWKNLFGGARDENPEQRNQRDVQSGDAAVHLTVATLHQQAGQLYMQGQYEQAIRTACEACNLALQKVGELHPLFAQSLVYLASFYDEKGDYAAAEPL